MKAKCVCVMSLTLIGIVMMTGMLWADSALPDLQGKTVVAVTGNDYTPLNFIDPKTGEAVGWEYDAVNEICRRLNCTVEWKVAS